MASIKQFANIPVTGIPNAPVQQFATDKSDAIRMQGNNALLEGAIQAGATGLQAYDVFQTQKAVTELVGDDANIPGMVKNPAELTGEEASFLNFQQIANARRQGLSSDRAKAAASTRLQQAIARDPRRADAYRSAFNNFFGGASGATFDLTDMEKAQREVIDYGLSQFNMDPRLAQTDPQRWEAQFQANMTLRNQQNEAERLLADSETGQKLSKMQQQSTFPQLVSSFITNPESDVYLPSVVDSILGQFRNEGGTFDASNAVAAEQQLNVQLTSIESQLRAQYSALDSGDFESMFAPIEQYFENAIAVANGEMSEAALRRENSIFKEAATQALYQGDPEAATLWVGLTSIIGDLETVPPSLRAAQERIGSRLVNAMPSLVDPTSPISAGDILNDREYEDFNEVVRSVVEGSIDASTGDVRERERAANGITLLAKDITSNSSKIEPDSYISYFIATGNEDVLNNLNPEQLAAVTESYGSESMEVFLRDTLAQWERGTRREGVNLQYNPDTNGLVAVVAADAPNRVRAIQDARRINREMGRTNIFFQSAQTVLGVSGEDILAGNDLGKGILAISGIEVSTDQPEIDFMDIPQLGQSNSRLAYLATSVAEDTASDSQMAELRRVLSRTPSLRDQNVPTLRQAIEKVDTPAQNGGTATNTGGVTLDNVVFTGREAVEEAEKVLGREPTAIEKRIAELEGYSTGAYEDTKGVTTSGFGQTGQFMDMSFEETVETFIDQTKEYLPNYEDYPEYLQAELVQAAYRGDLGQSPTFLQLLNDGNYEAAAEEFLNHEEYRTTSERGIKRRIEAVSNAIKKYAQEVR